MLADEGDAFSGSRGVALFDPADLSLLYPYQLAKERLRLPCVFSQLINTLTQYFFRKHTNAP